MRTNTHSTNMDTRTLQIVHEFDHEPTYIVTCDDDHEDIATVEPTTPNAVEVADELVRRWNAYPDLLKVAQLTAQWFEDAQPGTDEHSIAEQARAAIANATNTH